jgi:Fe-S cluster assembly protein SufD
MSETGMSETREPRDWFRDIVDKGQQQLSFNNISWLDQLRRNASQQLDDLAIPNRKQEIWRYSGMDKLFKDSFVPVEEDFTAIQKLDIEDYLLKDFDSYRLVIANGRCIPALSNVYELPEGVKLGSLRASLTTDPELMSAWFGHTAEHHQHVFTALNTALINDGVFVHIDAGVQLDKPIEVIYVSLSLDEPAMIQPRNLYVLEEGASATLIERYLSTGESRYFNNNLSELVLGEQAKLQHYRVQEESRQAYHLGSIFLSQKAASVYNSTSIAMGGAWARTDFNVDFREEGAECHLNGLYTVGDGQLQDFHLNVRHSVPNCASTENFKGILYGQGRAVFDGLIYVDKDAQGTDAHLSNANLMLTRKAEVDTKPQLEIYADDVKCSHGTTVGQLEPLQVYYLRSRGIDEITAHKMLCMGFAGEVVHNIEIDSLKNYLNSTIQNTLEPITQEMAHHDTEQATGTGDGN